MGSAWVRIITKTIVGIDEVNGSIISSFGTYETLPKGEMEHPKLHVVGRCKGASPLFFPMLALS